MSRRRTLGFLLGLAAVVVIAWGLLAAFKVQIDFPLATPPSPAQPRPVTISIDTGGAVSVREGAPPVEPSSSATPQAPRSVERARP